MTAIRALHQAGVRPRGPATEIRVQTVIHDRSVDVGDADRERVQTDLDVNWRPLLRSAESLA